MLILAMEEHPRDVRIRLRYLGANGLPSLFVFADRANPTPTTFDAIDRFVTARAYQARARGYARCLLEGARRK